MAEPATLPPLRQTQLAIDPASDPLVVRETDVLVDTLNSLASLMGSDPILRKT